MPKRALKLGNLAIDFNSHDLMKSHMHGMSVKTLVVLHETISHDEKGLGDIIGVERYLAQKDYGIHGMTDAEGNIAWALGLGSAIFWQAGGVNTQSIGIEQVSDIPARARSNEERKKLWVMRVHQLEATAKLLAAIHRTHPQIPLTYSDSTGPGITSHWDVSQHHPESQGHTDCFPIRHGGYYPLDAVIMMAKHYFKEGVA